MCLFQGDPGRDGEPGRPGNNGPLGPQVNHRDWKTEDKTQIHTKCKWGNRKDTCLNICFVTGWSWPSWKQRGQRRARWWCKWWRCRQAKMIYSVIFNSLSDILLSCVFQGLPGPDGPRGDRVRGINITWECLCVTAAKICVNICKIPCRAQLERRASKVPVETEVQGESQ